MLWVRSASLMRMTRMSRAIARIILRKFSACFSSRLVKLIWLILVTPSTSDGDLAAEPPLDLRRAWPACLRRVVQQPGGDARHVEPQVGDQAGDLDRVDRSTARPTAGAGRVDPRRTRRRARSGRYRPGMVGDDLVDEGRRRAHGLLSEGNRRRTSATSCSTICSGVRVVGARGRRRRRRCRPDRSRRSRGSASVGLVAGAVGLSTSRQSPPSRCGHPARSHLVARRQPDLEGVEASCAAR
jgi:hypothetical protein